MTYDIKYSLNTKLFELYKSDDWWAWGRFVATAETREEAIVKRQQLELAIE